jgi:hypothetical protein
VVDPNAAYATVVEGIAPNGDIFGYYIDSSFTYHG